MSGDRNMESLPDGVAASEDGVRLPAWHREVLDARLAEYVADPDAGRPWEQVEAEVRERLSNRR